MFGNPVKGVLIDIAGVLHDGGKPIDGSIEAIKRLAATKLPHRFVTNTTRSTSDQLLRRLQEMQFEVDPSSIFTAPNATLRYVEQQSLRPYLLIHPNLEPEFGAVDQQAFNAVVVGQHRYAGGNECDCFGSFVTNNLSAPRN